MQAVRLGSGAALVMLLLMVAQGKTFAAALPSNLTSSPSNWTDAPSNWTYAPSNWTDAPSNWTYAPSNWTDAPSNWTDAPSSNLTDAPSNWTYAPSNWTDAPSNLTDAPSNWTYAPSNWTNPPSNGTASGSGNGTPNYFFTASFAQPFSTSSFDRAVEQWLAAESLPKVTVVVMSITAPTLHKAARKLLQRSWTAQFRFEGESAPLVAQDFMQLSSSELASRFAISSVSSQVFAPSWDQAFVPGWLNINFTGTLSDASRLDGLAESLYEWCQAQTLLHVGCENPSFVMTPGSLSVTWWWPSNDTDAAHNFYSLPQSTLYSQFGFVYLTGVGIVPPMAGVNATTNLEFVFTFPSGFDEASFRQQLASALGLDVGSLNMTITSRNNATGAVTFHFDGPGAATLAQELNAMPLRDKHATFGNKGAQASPIETSSSGGSSVMPVVYVVVFAVGAILLGIAVGCGVRKFCCTQDDTTDKVVEGVPEDQYELAYKSAKII